MMILGFKNIGKPFLIEKFNYFKHFWFPIFSKLGSTHDACDLNCLNFISVFIILLNSNFILLTLIKLHFCSMFLIPQCVCCFSYSSNPNHYFESSSFLTTFIFATNYSKPINHYSFLSFSFDIFLRRIFIDACLSIYSPNLLSAFICLIPTYRIKHMFLALKNFY